MPIRDIIILGAIFATLPVCFFRPYFGIVMWTIVSFLNPHRFSWGVAYNFPVAMTVAIPTLAGAVVFSSVLRRFFSRDVLLIFLLWVWFTLTTLYNTSQPLFVHFAEDTWYRWEFVSKVLLMTLLTVAVVDSWGRFRVLLLVVAGCFGVLVLKAVPFMILTGGSFRLYGPDGSMVADNNDFGLTLNMTLPIFFFMAQTETQKWMKRLLWITFVATIPAVLFTYSRGALIGLALVLFLMLIRLRQRLVLVPVLAIAVVIAAFLAPERWQQRMDFRREGALVDDSALSRLNAWQYCWNIAKDHPFTGAGFEAYTPVLFDRYAPNPQDVHASHSIYFGVLAEHGFVGLSLYLMFLLSCFLKLRRAQNDAHRMGDTSAIAYARMFRFSLLAFLACGSFLGRAYFDYFFCIAGFAVILARLCRSDLAQMLAAPPAAMEQAA